jgi:hypothetical protein
MVRVGGGLRGRATSWPPTLSPSYYRTHAKDMRLKCPCMSLTSQASQIRPLHRRRIVEAITSVPWCTLRCAVAQVKQLYKSIRARLFRACCRMHKE